MDRAHDLGPATLGTLNGTGYMTRKSGNPNDPSGYVQGEGTLIVDRSTREEVEALMGEKLDYFGPTEDGDVSVEGCQIDSVEDFPTITFSAGS